MNDDESCTPPTAVLVKPVRTSRDEHQGVNFVQWSNSKVRRGIGEHELILDLARRWIPYGGPPEEEIFELFGIGREKYFELLRSAVQKLGDSALTAELTTVFSSWSP